MRWTPTLGLDPQAREPLSLQIARAVAADVQRGRLRPGDRLPGSRTLAASLGVHRNTVLAALDELVAQGWLETAPARGTFVSRAIPVALPTAAPSGPADRLGFELPPWPERLQETEAQPGVLQLSRGVPDPRLLPVELLARALRSTLARAGRRVLDYGPAQGGPALRRELAAMLAATRGLAVDAERVVVTRGSQMALYLAARVLLRPGDRVAVEALGYPPAWQALRDAGAELVPVPVDQGGLCLEPLRALLAAGQVRAVYLTPHHQFPTTVTLEAGRRLQLLQLAAAHGVALLEDDYDNELHFHGRPVLPLASADRAGVVVYVGTLSKVLAPGLRLGYAVAPRPVVERMAALRRVIDRQNDLTVEAAVAALLEEGEIQRHVRKMHRIYAARRAAMLAAVARELDGALQVQPSTGGMALWATAAGTDVDAWAERALQLRVAVATGRQYAFDGRPRPHLRLGYAYLDEAEAAEAVARLARALPGC